MCTGTLIRFFCPEAIMQNKLCPFYNPNGPTSVYRALWSPSEFVCCRNHDSRACITCPALRQPGNFRYSDTCSVVCDTCGARMKRDIDAEMEVRASVSGSEDTMDDESDDETTDVESDDSSIIDEEAERETEAAIEEADQLYNQEADPEVDEKAVEEADQGAGTEMDICDCPKCTNKCKNTTAMVTAEQSRPEFSITLTSPCGLKDQPQS
ncbi:uncharacterized protein B0H64DRAFT_373612 [Chaetomium fimeti]|uniref:Uncharacterized protein n=1 Tax=Chaetomium fimeti TaxID=1854472 RepID=A0AAE0HF56_9PEZI|nr:hypothetical protein B0H64DRAFT_373612 [Chaetomium fimeti]